MTDKLPADMTDEKLLIAANKELEKLLKFKMAPRPVIKKAAADTIEVRDDSDKGGLKLNQHINITGRVGKWMVIRVHETLPGQPRKYDIGPLPNRKMRKAHMARSRK